MIQLPLPGRERQKVVEPQTPSIRQAKVRIFPVTANGVHQHQLKTLTEMDTSLSEAARRFAMSPIADLTITPMDVLIARDEDCPVVVRDELTLITGQKKAFKSRILWKMVSSALGGKPENCLGFMAAKCPLKVVHLDTEQHSNSIKRQILGTLLSAGQDISWPHPNLVVYGGRRESVEVLREAIPYILKNHKPDILAIDVITDLVENFNDGLEANNLVRMLLRYAGEYHCAIVVSIHQNPGSEKERGHLGTELGNKTYGFIRLKRSGTTVTASSSNGCRGKEFPNFNVTWSEKDNDIVLTGQVLRQIGERASAETPILGNKPCPNQLAQDKEDYIRKLFLKKELWHYSELVQELCKKFKIAENCINTARRYVKTADKIGLIAKKDSKHNAPYFLAK